MFGAGTRATQGEIEAKFQAELIPGEKVLWAGQPRRDPRITWWDTVMFPMGLIFAFYGCGLFAAFAVGMWTKGINSFSHSIAPVIMFGLMGLIGLYIVAGRYFYRWWRNSRIYYAVTDRRAMIFYDYFKGHLDVIFLRSLQGLSLAEEKNGQGAVVFGPTAFNQISLWKTGLDSFHFQEKRSPLAFHEIDQVKDVYRLILAQQEALSVQKS